MYIKDFSIAQWVHGLAHMIIYLGKKQELPLPASANQFSRWMLVGTF